MCTFLSFLSYFLALFLFFLSLYDLHYNTSYPDMCIAYYACQVWHHIFTCITYLSCDALAVRSATSNIPWAIVFFVAYRFASNRPGAWKRKGKTLEWLNSRQKHLSATVTKSLTPSPLNRDIINEWSLIKIFQSNLCYKISFIQNKWFSRYSVLNDL